MQTSFTSPPNPAQEMAPPIIPGLTELSPAKHRAIFGQMQEESGEEDSLPRIISELGYLLARANELGPDALGVVDAIVKAFMKAYRQYPIKMDAMSLLETANPPLSMAAQGEADPRQALFSSILR